MIAFWVVVLANILLSHSLRVNRKYQEIATKTKIELQPMHIICAPNDIIRISAPMANDQSVYYLNKPNGDVIKLDLKTPELLKLDPREHSFLNIILNKNIKPIVTTENKNDVFSLNQDENILKRKEESLNTNEFLLGPVLHEDHGNWVLSVYTPDYNGELIEIFQIITIEIIENVYMNTVNPKLHKGDTLNLAFAYPIRDLVSCELIAPVTSYDRIYERSHLEMDRCNFTLRNVATEDAGIWRIVAVGRVVYEAETVVHVYK